MESGQIAAPSVPEIEIRPPRRWGELRLRELWEFRELLYFLVKRELQVRYKQSAFGVSWAVLQPIGLAALFVVVFGLILKQSVPGVPFPVFVLAGIVPWLFVSQSVGLSAQSLVAEAALISKVYFPRLAIPLAKISALLFDLCIAFVVLLVVAALYGVSVSATVLLIPGFMLIAAMVATGAGLLLSALNVRFRDVTVLTPILLQVWLFSSPFAYKSSDIPGNWRFAYALNPISSVMDGVRWCLYGAHGLRPAYVAISLASAAAILAAGVLYFRRTEQHFADII